MAYWLFINLLLYETDLLLTASELQVLRTVLWPVPAADSELQDRADSVMESSLQEILGSKKFALIKLSWKFTEVIMKANKVIHENLDTVC